MIMIKFELRTFKRKLAARLRRKRLSKIRFLQPYFRMYFFLNRARSFREREVAAATACHLLCSVRMSALCLALKTPRYPLRLNSQTNQQLLPMSVPSSSSRSPTIADDGFVEFYVGNAQVSISSGTLHLHKNWLVYPETCQVIICSNRCACDSE